MINIKSGKLVRVFLLCSDDEEISAAVQLGDGFVVGTSRGELMHYDSDCNVRWQKQGH